MKNQARQERSLARLSVASLMSLSVVLYLILLIVTAPATAMGWLLDRVGNQSIVLDQPLGSFWRGEAANMALRIQGQNDVSLGSLRWNLRLWPIFKGELRVILEIVSPGLQASHGVVSVGWNTLRLSQMDVKVPATLAAQIFPLLQIWQPGGELHFFTDDFLFGRRLTKGTAKLEWRQASSRLTTVNPLGTYQATLIGLGKPIGVSFEVKTISGILNMIGNGTWSPQNRLSFSGTARPDASAKKELQSFLRLWGKEQSDGSYQIAFSNTLPLQR